MGSRSDGVISKRRHVARKHYRCSSQIATDPGTALLGACTHGIRPGDTYWRLFGSAERGDPPYTIYVCAPCQALHDEWADEAEHLRAAREASRG